MSLAQAANGWIAGHDPDRSRLMRDEGCRCAHASGCRCRFTAGVASPDHNDIKLEHDRCSNPDRKKLKIKDTGVSRETRARPFHVKHSINDVSHETSLADAEATENRP
jgi:hypothetical protein